MKTEHAADNKAQEWTAEDIKELLAITGHQAPPITVEAIRKAINASIAAEREHVVILTATKSELLNQLREAGERALLQALQTDNVIQQLREQLSDMQATMTSLGIVIDTNALDAAIAEAIKGVTVIRCIEHINVPQINTTEFTGGECGVCAFDKGAAAAQQPLVDALKKCKSQLDMEPQRLPLVERLQGYIKDALDDFTRSSGNREARQNVLG